MRRASAAGTLALHMGTHIVRSGRSFPLRTAWLAAALLLLALALALPRGAQAGFSSQLLPLTGPVAGDNTTLSDVAINPAGEALIAWTQGDTTGSVVMARRLKPDGTLGAPLTISDGTQMASQAKVSFAPNGRALVAWAERTPGANASVRARWIEPDDNLGAQITARNGGVSSNSGELAVTATTSNEAFVAFHNFTSSPGPFRRVEVVRVAADGTPSGVLLPTSGAGSLGVRVAPNSSGGALLVWRESDVKAQPVAANDSFGSLQTPGPGAAAGPTLATDGRDHFQLLFRAGSSPYSLEYRPLLTGGLASAGQALDPSGPGLIGSHDVATNSANRSLTAWSRPVGTTDVVHARFIASDGTPEVDTFSAPDPAGKQQSPNVGIGGGSGGAIAWVLTPPAGNATIWGRIFPAGGTPQTPVPLSSATSDSSSGPLVEMAANDVGLAAWREHIDPQNPGVGLAQIVVRQILPPPQCPDTSGTIVHGRPTQIDLHCSGLQLFAPEISSPPAHGTLGPPDAAHQSVVYTPTPGYQGADSFTFRGVGNGGRGTTQTATLRVVKDTDTVAPVRKDTIAPRITRFVISPRLVQLAAASRARKPQQTSITFSLTYSEASTATITIERARKCRRGARRCKTFEKFGSLTARAPARAAKVTFKARIGRRKLRPGTYRASAVATDLAGNASKVKRLSFTVRRHP